MSKVSKKSVLDFYPSYRAVIGIEVHVQLQTKSKIFCPCPNKFGSTPNSNICHICSGSLGTLPTINHQAINYAIKAGLATNCSISKVTEFARKHYAYPDLPKNYQITQDDKPICNEGFLFIKDKEGQEKKIRIQRIHMEEDAGKNLHDQGGQDSLVDLNRAGTPLIEIVSHPDISNADEAVAYLEKLRLIVRHIEVSRADMEKGSFRADVNISVMKKDAKEFGTRVELKNINSFKHIHNAIEFELERQINMVENGQKFEQETRLWNEKKNETIFMRTKEDCQDYRYFADPDLPITVIDDEWVERIQNEIPELPDAKQARFIKEFGLSEYEAEIICSDRKISDLFEKSAKLSKLAKKVSNWILRDLLGYIKENKVEFDQLKITPEMLSELVIEVEKGIINSSSAKEVFAEMIETGKYPSIIIQEKGFEQVGSEEELRKIAQELIDSNPTQAQQFRDGNERIMPFFIGQAMKLTKGKANPKILSGLLKELLAL